MPIESGAYSSNTRHAAENAELVRARGMAWPSLGTDGSARCSSSSSPAWWTGPPPIPRCGPPRATNRVTRPPRRSSPQEAARGFWIRAWGQREPAHRGTGRLSDPARWPESLKGGLDVPCASHQMQLTSHRTPDPDVDALRFGHSPVESGPLSFMRKLVPSITTPSP
jgi:hypothetical protein